MIKLSILVPSNRADLNTYSRLLNYCSMAADDVEVIIRDNSGNKEKRQFLRMVERDNCRILHVAPCSAVENSEAVLREARGEFVWLGGDDDLANGFALPSIREAIDRHGSDNTVTGVTGVFLIEGSARSSVIAFPNTDHPSPVERTKAYIGSHLPNMLPYSAIRRSAYDDIVSFIRRMPLQASYGDWIMSALALMMGRFVQVNHVIYQYDISNWNNAESALREDVKYYTYAGIDPSAIRLHCLLAAFEGALSLAGKFEAAQHVTSEDRLAISQDWFAQWFATFLNARPRFAPGAKFQPQAEDMAQKWAKTSTVRPGDLLPEIAAFLALSSHELGQRYFDFWK